MTCRILVAQKYKIHQVQLIRYSAPSQISVTNPFLIWKVFKPHRSILHLFSHLLACVTFGLDQFLLLQEAQHPSCLHVKQARIGTKHNCNNTKALEFCKNFTGNSSILTESGKIPAFQGLIVEGQCQPAIRCNHKNCFVFGTVIFIVAGNLNGDKLQISKQLRTDCVPIVNRWN